MTKSDPIHTAKRKLIAQLKESGLDVAVGLSWKEGSQCLTIRIHTLTDEAKNKIPATIDGFAVTVRATGTVVKRQKPLA